MPESTPVTPDVIAQLCEAITQYHNAALDSHNFGQQKPDAPSEADAARKKVWNLWGHLKDSLARKPNVTPRDLHDISDKILSVLNWGRRLMPLTVTRENEETSESQAFELDRADTRGDLFFNLDNEFHPVPGVDPADLRDPLKYGAHVLRVQDRLRELRSFIADTVPARPVESPTPQGGTTSELIEANSSSTHAKGLKPSQAKAKAIYGWALENIDGVENMTYAQLFDKLQNDPRCAGEGLPDSAATFARYCRAAAIRRNTARRAKGPTRSVRRASDL